MEIKIYVKVLYDLVVKDDNIDKNYEKNKEVDFIEEVVL